ncbi:Por secretion system C-terminal sorting domain-containing protein [Hymenobacter daecheongensis DSM 21074]|uniref:Por secretion system C-terminal sorting domain-containing protein n=1 Tax=Hymenobacter daecheongensis DSM 21074 TaxID=1121955 RepID=A0A1M6CQK9_9BACT|nr:T9SS type A sorting domain-containing protein [Hymenobacter daecheongensis]SHI63266.1 Por secretion system C-terminal sorting domain-containing protein [Hymenobacter daecheongensis DSM 21074]
MSILRALTLLGLFILTTTLQASATHIVGAEISYVPVPNSNPNDFRYYVTARLYRDISGSTTVDFGQTIPLYCRKNGCTAADPGSFTATLTRMSTTQLAYVRCSGASSVELQVFSAEVRLYPGSWALSIAEENRTQGIMNLTNSANYGLYADAELNNSAAARALPNTSPVFTSSRLPYICGSQFHRYSFAAFDADGDSLVYRLAAPLAASTADPCPRPIPGVASPHFDIRPATGELFTIPFSLTLGIFNVVVRVDEYRRINSQWLKIGSVMRDLTYPVSTNAGNRNPTFTTLTAGTASQPVGQLIRVSPGQSLSLTLNATDQDAGQTLRFASDAAATIPGVTFQTLSATQARLSWQVPATLPPGRYTIPVAVSDNACPTNGIEAQTLTFLVGSQVLAAHPPQPGLELAAYPMPFREQVRFQLYSSGPQQIQITDNLGRIVAKLTSQANGTVVWRPAASLAPGLYLARTPDGRQRLRLLRE